MQLKNKFLLFFALIAASFFFISMPVQAAKLTGQVTITSQNDVYALNKKGTIKTYKDSSKEWNQGTVLTYHGVPKIIKGRAYYPLGKDTYVAASATNLPTGPVTLQVDHNSYIFNSKGKRIKSYHGKSKIKPQNTVIYAGHAINTKTPKKYYSLYWTNRKDSYDNLSQDYFMIKQRFYLKYHRIKSQDYYPIGKNVYIKARNVKFIAGKPIYKTGWTTITVTHNTHTYDNHNWKIRKGQHFRTKLYGYWPDLSEIGIPNNLHPDHPFLFYRVKMRGKTANIFWTDALPKRNIEFINFENLHNTFVRAQRNIHVYNAAGQVVQPNYMIDANGEQTNSSFGFYTLNVDRLQYLYNPQTKQTVLYYHLKQQKIPMIKQNSESDFADNIKVGSAFVKASEVTYSSGKKLKAINSAEQARKGSQIASKEEKVSLQKRIRQADKVRKTDKYYLSSSYTLRDAFNAARHNAEQVNSNQHATINMVKDAENTLRAKQKALNGKKIMVKNIHHLTDHEASQIVNLAENALEHNEDSVYVQFYKHNTVLKVGDPTVEATHRLKISDFAREK